MSDEKKPRWIDVKRCRIQMESRWGGDAHPETCTEPSVHPSGRCDGHATRSDIRIQAFKEAAAALKKRCNCWAIGNAGDKSPEDLTCTACFHAAHILALAEKGSEK